MWQHKSISVLTLGFFLFAVSASRCDDFSDRIVGTWKTKENFAGYDLRTTVTKEGDQWSIKGTFEKDGSVAGTFVGEKVGAADGSLTFMFKVVKKPACV